MDFIQNIKAKKRIIYSFLAVIILVTGIRLYLDIQQYKQMYDINLNAKKEKVKTLYDVALQDIINFYILKVNYIFQSPEILNAIKDGDREKLYKLVLPYYTELQKEQKSLELVHFHTPEANSFLRMHRPERFGDDLNHIRPIVRNVNIEKKFMHGFEVGKFSNNAITYRLVFPIFNDENEHLGSVEFGVDFLQKIKDIYSMYNDVTSEDNSGMYGGFLFRTTKLQYLVDQHSFQEFGSYSLVDPSEFLKEHLNELPKDIFSKLGTYTQRIGDEHYYIVWDSVIAKNFQQETNGAGIYVFNVSDMIYEYDALVLRSLIITIFMLLSMYLILTKGLDHFLKRLESSSNQIKDLIHWKHEILSLFDNGKVAVIKVKNDENWTVEFASSSIKDILNYSQAYITNKNISLKNDLICQECLSAFVAGIEDAKFQLLEHVDHYPYRLKKRNGDLIWVQSHTVINYNKNNEADSFLIAISDISHIKEMEYDLSIMKNRFELAIESTKDGLWDLDLINKDIYLSPQFLHKTKYTEIEFKKLVKNKSLGAVEQFIVHKDDLEMFKTKMDSNLRNETDFFNIEYRMRTDLEKEEYLWVLSRGKVLFDEDTGETSRIVGFNTDISKQKEAEEHLRKLATIDDLTKIANRVKFKEILEREVDRARRYKNTLAMIYFDVDFLKHINENFGHSVGDELLKKLTQTIQIILRKSDVFARWGGEEFVILAPETTSENAFALAEKLRILVKKTEFKEIGHITCSFGVTQFTMHDTTDTFFERAEKALEIAKEEGRDKVVNIQEEI